MAGARAQYNQEVAAYRQAVLTAFQQVEDNLAAMTAYRGELVDLTEAAAAADKAATIALNEYKAGTVDYTTVASTQLTANSAHLRVVDMVVSRQTTAVALIQAIGGEWTNTACTPAQTGITAGCGSPQG